MSTPAPRLGSTVLYQPHRNEPGGDGSWPQQAATINAVHSHDVVSLHVFVPCATGGQMASVTSVARRGSKLDQSTAGEGTWTERPKAEKSDSAAAASKKR